MTEGNRQLSRAMAEAMPTAAASSTPHDKVIANAAGEADVQPEAKSPKKIAAASPTKAKMAELELAVDRIMTAQGEAPKKRGRNFKRTRPPPSITIDPRTESMMATAPAAVFQMGTPTSRDAHFIGTPTGKKDLRAEQERSKSADRKGHASVTLNEQEWPSEIVIQSQPDREPVIRDLLPEAADPQSHPEEHIKDEAQVVEEKKQEVDEDSKEEVKEEAKKETASVEEKVQKEAQGSDEKAEEVREDSKDEVKEEAKKETVPVEAVKQGVPSIGTEVILPLENRPIGSPTKISQKAKLTQGKQAEIHIQKCKVIEDGFLLARSLEEKGNLKEAEAQFRRTLGICSTLLGERPRSAHKSMGDLRAATSSALERLRRS
eukprot:gnl/MRDRNA2_/MRDRNA2_90196_c0_seq1.p1 gnl/MRDRNA2_/MRDRNA2_90196_c0~~gnl/MRDRNA2_/MRDRNA2_90196_c0_seq1.p1  ORF type:complete len:376 (-),score=118.19 gnl/MRDRNA2_/MRDRNA2_90196_c0_seq1:48-1175(-)